jgi:hypothetical protein
MDFTTLRGGDELVLGPLTGVRLWVYRLKTMQIQSFQYFHEWTPDAPTEDPDALEPWRGLNVYKSEADAMRESADAINDIIEQPEKWHNACAGIVLGAVEFWGVTWEHEFCYGAQYVKPTGFIRAWGAREETIADELNSIWFGGDNGRER